MDGEARMIDSLRANIHQEHGDDAVGEGRLALDLVERPNDALAFLRIEAGAGDAGPYCTIIGVEQERQILLQALGIHPDAEQGDAHLMSYAAVDGGDGAHARGVMIFDCQFIEVMDKRSSKCKNKNWHILKRGGRD